MNMYILLKDVRFYARHGVDPQETAVGAIFCTLTAIFIKRAAGEE